MAHACGCVDARRIIRAGIAAGSAADAHVGVGVHETGCFVFLHGARWAVLDARRGIAVVARNGNVIVERRFLPSVLFRFRPRSAFVIVYATEEDGGPEIVVVLAHELAGFTTGAARGVEMESILSHHLPPMPS